MSVERGLRTLNGAEITVSLGGREIGAVQSISYDLDRKPDPVFTIDTDGITGVYGGDRRFQLNSAGITFTTPIRVANEDVFRSLFGGINGTSYQNFGIPDPYEEVMIHGDNIDKEFKRVRFSKKPSNNAQAAKQLLRKVEEY